MLFDPELVGDYLADHFLPVITAERDAVGSDKNIAAVDAVDLAAGHDIRLMYADKSRGIELFLQVFQVKERHVFTPHGMNGDVIL